MVSYGLLLSERKWATPILLPGKTFKLQFQDEAKVTQVGWPWHRRGRLFWQRAHVHVPRMSAWTQTTWSLSKISCFMFPKCQKSLQRFVKSVPAKLHWVFRIQACGHQIQEENNLVSIFVLKHLSSSWNVLDMCKCNAMRRMPCAVLWSLHRRDLANCLLWENLCEGLTNWTLSCPFSTKDAALWHLANMANFIKLLFW